MKKYLWFIAALLLTACAGIQDKMNTLRTPTFTDQTLLGKWTCKSSYSKWDLLTEEDYIYNKNHTIDNKGKMTIVRDAVEVTYKYKAKATWALDGWYLVEKLKSAKLDRAFSKETKLALRKSESLRKWEQWVYKQITDQINTELNPNNPPARRLIRDLTPTLLTTRADNLFEFEPSYVICAR